MISGSCYKLAFAYNAVINFSWKKKKIIVEEMDYELLVSDFAGVVLSNSGWWAVTRSQ